MRRRLVTIAAFLLAGTVMNLAMAWMCAARSEARGHGPPLHGPPTQDRVHAIIRSTNIFDRPFQVLGTMTMPGFGVCRTTIQAASSASDAVAPTMAMIVHAESGWPARAFHADIAMVGPESAPSVRVFGGLPVTKWLGQPQGQVSGALPLRPLWRGFAVNTVTCAVFLWLLIRGPRRLRRVVRVTGGRCPQCAYPIGDSLLCTECGQSLATGANAWLQRLATTARGRRIKRYAVVPVVIVALGAMTNVAVAWACAVWSPEDAARTQARQAAAIPSAAEQSWWRRHAPADVSPEPPIRATRTVLGLGKERLTMFQSARREPTFTPGGVVIVTFAGWPMLSMHHARWKAVVTQEHEAVRGLLLVPRALPGMKDAFVPLKPVWPGILVNSLAYATALYVLGLAVSRTRRRAAPAPSRG